MTKVRKHVIDVDQVAVNVSSITNHLIASGTLNPDYFTNTNNVMAESRVPYIAFQVDYTWNPTAAVVYNAVNWYIGFNVNNSQVLPDPDVVGSSHLKNQIFHQEGGHLLVPTTALFSATQNGLTWRGVVRMPKQWQIVNDGDVIAFSIKNTSNSANANYKLKFVYMEYRY